VQAILATIFYNIDPECSAQVAKGLKLALKEVKRLAEMTQNERAKATAQ
jgi:catalase